MVNIIVVQGMIFILRLHLQNGETKTTICYIPAVDSIDNSCSVLYVWDILICGTYFVFSISLWESKSGGKWIMSGGGWSTWCRHRSVFHSKVWHFNFSGNRSAVLPSVAISPLTVVLLQAGIKLWCFPKETWPPKPPRADTIVPTRDWLTLIFLRGGWRSSGT